MIEPTATNLLLITIVTVLMLWVYFKQLQRAAQWYFGTLRFPRDAIGVYHDTGTDPSFKSQHLSVTAKNRKSVKRSNEEGFDVAVVWINLGEYQEREALETTEEILVDYADLIKEQFTTHNGWDTDSLKASLTSYDPTPDPEVYEFIVNYGKGRSGFKKRTFSLTKNEMDRLIADGADVTEDVLLQESSSSD